MKLGELAANPKNPRTITDAKLKHLKRALDEFGDLGGIVYNRKTKQLVGGHQRSKLLGPKSEIVIERKFPKATRTGTVAEGFVVSNGERFKYREVHWDASREKAANIAANKGVGEWDTAQLTEWMTELKDIKFDLDLTMFDESERAGFFPASETGADGKHEDEAPAPLKKARTKLGDLYVLCEHRLLCGDSTSPPQVERLMNGERADMVFTDPPYGMNLDTDYSKMPIGGQVKKGTIGKKWAPVIGDDVPFDPATIFEFFEYVKEIFLWGGDYYYERLLPNGTFMVWDKNNGNVNADKMIGSGFEFCWTKQKHKKEMCRIFARGTFGHDKVKVHPTQKPVQLAEWFFARWGEDNNLVVDLFGGSGSTMIACEKTKRRCFMMELDPIYCDVIVERWEKYTGKKATLLRSEADAPGAQNGKTKKASDRPTDSERPSAKSARSGSAKSRSAHAKTNDESGNRRSRDADPLS